MSDKPDSAFERQQARLRAAVPDALRALREIAAGPKPTKARSAARAALKRYLHRVAPEGGKQ